MPYDEIAKIAGPGLVSGSLVASLECLRRPGS